MRIGGELVKKSFLQVHDSLFRSRSIDWGLEYQSIRTAKCLFLT